MELREWNGARGNQVSRLPMDAGFGSIHFHHRCTKQTSHQMALSTIQPIYDLRNCPKCLTSKFRFIYSIFRTTSTAKTENALHWIPFHECPSFKSPVAPLASLLHARKKTTLYRIDSLTFCINSKKPNHI